MSEKNKTIGIMVGRIIDEIGPIRIWDAYFDSIEKAFPDLNAVKEYPLIMKKIYRKGIKKKNASKALKEMRAIANILGQIKSDYGIFLSEYHVTSTGRQITGVLLECIQASLDEGEDLKIIIYGDIADIAFQ